jgi:hypothetical protein
LFCPNPVDSCEHIWSDWILKDLKLGSRIQIKFGNSFAKWVDDPEVKIKCVCQKCNNGWMSDIEGENKPHMLAIMNDKPTILTPTEQKSLARWTILKAMVIDGARPKQRIPFYSLSERLDMKPPSRFVPPGTLVWIGRLSVKSLHAAILDSRGQINGIDEAYRGCITTIIVGHLAIQALTIHVLPRFLGMLRRLHIDPKPGAWDMNLLDIWPVFGEMSWPPAVTFTLGRTSTSIGHLADRFRIGTDITK